MIEERIKSFAQLKHTVAAIPETGGMVLVLDNGAVIDAEAEAMLQALYSRDPASVREHLDTIAEKGPEKFMATYYVGYNHKSIGDCGSGTVFIEGVSMLAAKAVQDWMLYSGQEISTRYVDFAHQPFIDPVANDLSRRVHERLRAFYVASLEPLKMNLRARYPRESEEPEKRYETAIAARAFDILRSFLPAGASTSLAWHTNLRQAADKLTLLRHHPLGEVRNVAAALEEGFVKKFPSSFGHKRYEATEAYNKLWMGANYLFKGRGDFPEFALTRNAVDRAYLIEHRDLFAARPPKTEFPKFLAEAGTVTFEYLLDFGSFRDIQRQRSVIQRMPLVSTAFGFEPWYLQELPATLRVEAEQVLDETEKDLTKLAAQNVPLETLQYFVPMGYRVPNRMTGDIPAFVYIAELRATPMVHPTLQLRAHQIAEALEHEFGELGLKVYVSDEIGRFDTRRGAQTIEKRDA